MPEEQHPALTIINRCQEFLGSCRAELKAVKNDPYGKQWQKINIDAMAATLKALGISPHLRQARDKYPKLERQLLAAIIHHENDFKNLLTEINHRQSTSKTDITEAQRISNHCQQETPPLLKQLKKYRAILRQASLTLQENLTIHSLSPLAREQLSGKKRNLFNSGFEVYLIVNGEQDEAIANTDLVNMYTFFDRAALWQKKITAYKLPDLAATAASLVKQQLELCQEGLSQVKLAVNLMEQLFAKELTAFHLFKKKLATLQEKPVADILALLPDFTEELSSCLRNFAAKKFLLQELSKVELLQENCEQFFTDIQDYFVPYLVEEIAKDRSIINPQTLAISRSKSYFKGAKGMWRTIRLLGLALGGYPPISPSQLEEKLFHGLADCHLYFSAQDTDAMDLQQYISQPFKDYASPFPAQELTLLLQRTLLTYSAILQKVFIRFKANHPDSDRTPPTLGRLNAKLEIGIDYLQSYQKKSEKMLG